MKYIFTIFIVVSGIIPVWSQSIAGPDKYIFKKTSVIIGPDSHDPNLCYYWEPKELLDDNTLPNPTATVSETTTFRVTVTGKNFSYLKNESMTVRKVKVESISSSASYCGQGSSLNFSAKLSGDIALPNDWQIGWKGEGSLSNMAVSATETFGNPNAGNVTKAWIEGSTDTAKTSTLVVGFEVKEIEPKPYYCDGSPISMYISALPNGTPQSYLNCFSNFTINSQPTLLSFGNPAGTTNLTFTQVSDDYKFNIENAIWYSNTIEKCNKISLYLLSAKATNKDGKIIDAVNPNQIAVSAGKDCIVGASGCCERYFTGKVDIQPYQYGQDIWMVKIYVGTFARDLIPDPITIELSPNSQFYSMVMREEDYHNQQRLGIVPIECVKSTYSVDSVFKFIYERQAQGAVVELTEAEARAKAEQLVMDCQTKEIERSHAYFTRGQPCWCACEYDAKTHFGDDLFIGSWLCDHAESCPFYNP
jgi:hypothetical protein